MHSNRFAMQIHTAYKSIIVGGHVCLACSCLSVGYEPHQLIWHHQGPAVCLLHRAVLWAGDGSARSGSPPCQRDGWTPTDAQRFPQLPGQCYRECPPHSPLLQIHRSHPHVLQVSVACETNSRPFKIYFSKQSQEQVSMLNKIHENMMQRLGKCLEHSDEHVEHMVSVINKH